MGINKEKDQKRFMLPIVSAILPLFLFMILLTGVYSMAQEENAAAEATQKDSAITKDGNRGTIVNRYGNVIGFVDSRGNIANVSGFILGSVDADGNIFNVSRINIGRVSGEGKVFNQAGTVMGSVNDQGEVFNVSGTKMGEVKGNIDLNGAGGAARLVILK
jgi:hypothetical protein